MNNFEISVGYVCYTSYEHLLISSVLMQTNDFDVDRCK